MCSPEDACTQRSCEAAHRAIHVYVQIAGEKASKTIREWRGREGGREVEGDRGRVREK